MMKRRFTLEVNREQRKKNLTNSLARATHTAPHRVDR
jgi:hypothetical protein